LVNFSSNSENNSKILGDICSCTSKSLYINAYAALQQVSNCFEKLISNESTSDVTIELIDSETGEMTKIFAHKLFLSRSPHFENMFKSGMSESTENVINLHEFTKDGFLQVLLYLYTDKIIINPTNW